MRTTSPDFTMTRETYTWTQQGSVMALNIGGWSAEEEPEPEPEDEEVSRFISLSDPILISAMSLGKPVKNVTLQVTKKDNTCWIN